MKANETRTSGISKTGWMLTAVLLATSAMAQTVSAPATKAAKSKRQVVVVSLTGRKLALVEDGRVLKTYPVAVGAAVSPSPTGQFTIVSRLVKPTYYHPGTVIEPGPKNPLGTRWIGLSHKGYGIHGTNAPRSIGKAASHGCIRMAKADLEELFGILRVGDAVEIRTGDDSATAALFGASTVLAQTQAPAATVAGGGQ